MGGYERIVKWKGGLYLKRSAVSQVIYIGRADQPLTKRGEKKANEISNEAARALVLRHEKRSR